MVDRLSKAERLRLVLEALSDAPPATGAAAALQLMADCLNRIEDLHSGVPAEPLPPKDVDTGRMYPPQSDSIQRLEDGSIVAHTRAHIVRCGSNGSISVETRRGHVVFYKWGVRHDGDE